MRVNGNYNTNTYNRTSESKDVQRKPSNNDNQNKRRNDVDTFERSTPQDIKYGNYADIAHQYMQALYALQYNIKQEPLTVNDELEIEASKDNPTIVENMSESNPTHNNDTHNYNQDSNSGSNESDTKKDKED